MNNFPKKLVKALSVFAALSICLAPARSQDFTIDDVLNASNSVSLYNNYRDGAERHELTSQMFTRLEENSEERKFKPIADLLCNARPWSTGDQAKDAEMQQRIWELALQEPNAHTDNFESLDCAAAKMQGFYFDRVVYVINAYVRSIEDTGESDDLNANVILASIKAIDARILQNYGGDEVESLVSYYPLRNARRIASLYAALGVEKAKQGNWRNAREQFQLAANALIEWLEDPSRLAQTRNGWRNVVELDFLAELYSWIANNGGQPFDASKFAGWEPAVTDETTLIALHPDELKNIPLSYVDPISVERLFPGAAEGEDERDRWEYRVFDIREFAEYVGECSKNHIVVDLTTLQEFDTCVATYEASDWRIQFEAFRGNQADVGGELALGRVQFFQNALNQFVEEQHPSMVLPKVIAENQGSWIVIKTESLINDSQRDIIREGIVEYFPSAFIGRPRSY